MKSVYTSMDSNPKLYTPFYNWGDGDVGFNGVENISFISRTPSYTHLNAGVVISTRGAL